MLWLLWPLILNAAAADPGPAFTSSNRSCQLYYQEETSSYEAFCDSKDVVHSKKIKLTPTAELSNDFQSLKNFIMTYSSDKKVDEEKLKEVVLKNLETKMRFEYPGDEALLKTSLKDLDSFNSGLSPLEECDDSEKSQITPFVDLKLDATSLSYVEQKLVDEKMALDGFRPLGKLKGISLQFGTDNDNFLHGVGQKIIEDYNNPPWWEGDDRGYTFGLDMTAQMNYERGHVKVSSYTKGYSELASIQTPVTVCAGSSCQTSFINQTRDEENKRYLNFLSVDGVELEVRVNQLTGDKYVKLIGSVEHLTDSDKSVGQKIQKEWHELGKAIEYHYLDHRDSETRVQAGLAVGVEKSAKPLNWLGVRGAIEGKAQGSTSGLDNSYVGVSTELSVNSNQLFRSSSRQEPVLEATLKADHKHYGNNQTYTNIGVTLYGSVYSDRHGNVVKVFAGIEEHKNPFTDRYSHKEISRTGRADLIHTVGIKYERKF